MRKIKFKKEKYDMFWYPKALEMSEEELVKAAYDAYQKLKEYEEFRVLWYVVFTKGITLTVDSNAEGLRIGVIK
jgi:hypothetical protein